MMTRRHDQPLDDQPPRRSLRARLLSASVPMRRGGGRRPVPAASPRSRFPARRLLRPSALLLAAVQIGVAALLISPAEPAQAQSDTVWSATLTVPTVLANRAGCSLYPASNPAQRCSNRNVLTDDSFTVDGTDYRIDIFTLSGSGQDLKLTLDNPISDSVKALTLQVDGENFLLSEATIQSDSIQNDTALWNNTGLSWSAGDRVSVRLVHLRDDWRSWNPTLTVNDEGGGDSGCVATTCNEQLTDDTFVYDGTPITVRQLTLSTTTVWFSVRFDRNIPSGFAAFSLQVGSERFRFSGGDVNAGGVGQNNVTFGNKGMSWSVGDRVRLRLIPGPAGAPTGLTVSPGPRADTIAAAWTAPDTALTARVTGYEVRYKGIYAPNAEASTADDPTTGWVTKRVGTTPRATLNAVWTPGGARENNGATYAGSPFVVQVRSLSASDPGAWSAQAQGSPKPPPGGPAATPLQILSASRTSVREGDAPITITARLAQPAPTGGVVIPISHEQMHGKTPPHGLGLAMLAAACDDPNNAEKDYTFAPASITIAEGQRTGTATLTVCDDNVEDTNEYIYLHPGRVPNEAYPASGSGVYQLRSLRITILNDETGTDGNGGTGESASPPPHHSDPYLAELQERIIRCAASIKTTVDQYVAGTATAEQVRAARAASAACQ